jgi:hypothetical protein
MIRAIPRHKLSGNSVATSELIPQAALDFGCEAAHLPEVAVGGEHGTLPREHSELALAHRGKLKTPRRLQTIASLKGFMQRVQPSQPETGVGICCIGSDAMPPRSYLVQ